MKWLKMLFFLMQFFLIILGENTCSETYGERIPNKLKEILESVTENKHNLTICFVKKESEKLANFTSSANEMNKDEVDAIVNALSKLSNFDSSSLQVAEDTICLEEKGVNDISGSSKPMENMNTTKEDDDYTAQNVIGKVVLSVLKAVDDIITFGEECDNLISENSSKIALQFLEQQLEYVRFSGQNFSHTFQHMAVNVVNVENMKNSIKIHLSSATNFPKVLSIQLDPKTLLAGQKTLPLSVVVHRTDALFRNSKTENSSWEVNSFIITASTSVQIRTLPPDFLVTITFSPMNKSHSGITQCMFWNHTLHGSLGGWSGEGCYLEENDTFNVLMCFCNHLTSFAILISPTEDIDHDFVSFVTLIGCTISIICLTLTIVSLSASPNIRRKVPQKIIIHLSLALLGLYSFFLIGVDRTDLQIGCVIFGALIHFFCLASIAWMSVEATNMYLMFVKVIKANLRYFLLTASLFAWGFPLFITVTSAIVSSDSYVNDKSCFPHHDSLVFYISVFALVFLLLVYNFLIYVLVIYKLSCRGKKMSSVSNTKRDTIRRLQNAFAISVLLGITWIFGLFPAEDHTLNLLFSILFCLFNSLQGCFIFLLFGLRQEEVRKTWKKWLHICKRKEKANISAGLRGQTDQGDVLEPPDEHRPVGHQNKKQTTDPARS